MLQDPEHWIWDSWIADDGERYHLFFLKAPAALKDPALRHEAAFIGHASSTDLTSGTLHADALTPGDHGTLGRPGAVDGLGRPRRRRHLADVLHGAEHQPRAHRARPADRPGGVQGPRDLDARGRPAARRARSRLVPHARAGRQRDVARPVRLPSRRPVAHADHRPRPGRAAPEGRHPRPRHARTTWSRGSSSRRSPRRPASGSSRCRRCATSTASGCSSSPATRRSRARTSDSRSGTTARGSSPPTRRSARSTSPAPSRSPTDPKLFAAPLVQTRDGQWVFVGFRNTEPEGVLNFHIIDPLPLHG